MSLQANAERLERLKADVDSRLVELWALLWSTPSAITAMLDDDGARDALAQVLRHAYAQGYQDALREDATGQRGELARRHGYSHH